MRFEGGMPNKCPRREGGEEMAKHRCELSAVMATAQKAIGTVGIVLPGLHRQRAEARANPGAANPRASADGETADGETKIKIRTQRILSHDKRSHDSVLWGAHAHAHAHVHVHVT